jgi:transposase
VLRSRVILPRKRLLLGLIRFGGHLPKGKYDVDHGGHEGTTDATQFHRRLQEGAVRLVLDEGKTVAAAARDLGLTESSLRNWVEQARADRTKGKTGLTTAEREELARLRKEVRELRMERDVQKKAAAFFAKDHL